MPLTVPVMSAEELQRFLETHFPSGENLPLRVEEIANMSARVRLFCNERFLRPGGTVSGPALMTLADTAAYVALLGMIGPVALAVTSSLNIHFLRRPRAADVIGSARLLRLGKRLAVAEVTLFSEGEEDPVASATVTYAVPSR